MLGNYPSSTPFHPAVPPLNIRVELKKYDKNVGDPFQQYPLSIWQCPLKILDGKYRILFTKLGNNPGSTPFNLAVPP